MAPISSASVTSPVFTRAITMIVEVATMRQVIPLKILRKCDSFSKPIFQFGYGFAVDKSQLIGLAKPVLHSEGVLQLAHF